MRERHRRAVELAAEAEAKDGDGPAEAAQRAWDEWAEEADLLGVCLTCEAESPASAYCPDH